MRLRDFDVKTRIYLAIVALLFVYIEWVDRISAGVRSITLLLKEVF
jgi:hypothetical protein